MAHAVSGLVQSSSPDDRFLLLLGVGHMAYGHGVPERLFARQPQLAAQSYSIYCRGAAHGLLLHELEHAAPEGLVAEMTRLFGENDALPAADVCFGFELDESGENMEPAAATAREPPGDGVAAAQVKAETARAYDSVGETAHLQGNAQKAEAVMRRLRYTPEEIQIAGADAYNYQGVGSPHRHVAISAGDAVLDLGSGLGIDSFIAAASAENGRVVGVDISASEVHHANARAAVRGVADRLSFVMADIERLPSVPQLEAGSFDVVISNGVSQHATLSTLEPAEQWALQVEGSPAVPYKIGRAHV